MRQSIIKTIKKSVALKIISARSQPRGTPGSKILLREPKKYHLRFFFFRDTNFLLILIFKYFMFNLFENVLERIFVMSEGVANKNSLRVTNMKERMVDYKGNFTSFLEI